jgi:tRNA threonylcarbamoyladenosine biosynthesis protein TsaB
MMSRKHLSRSEKPSREDPVFIALETATRIGGLALMRGEKPLLALTHSPPSGHSATLMPAVESMATLSGIPPSAWEAVVVSSGPGSFTGLRIGMATAKALSIGLKIPLYGVPTLDALASRLLPLGEKQICPVLDARKGQLFTSLYINTMDGSLERVQELRSVYPEDLPSVAPPEALFTGDGLDVYGEELKKIYGVQLRFAPTAYRYPDPVSTALSGLLKILNNLPSELLCLQPEYVRPSDAELKYGDEGGGTNTS